ARSPFPRTGRAPAAGYALPLHDALPILHRVTRPGGRIVICEFSHPTWTPFRTVYTEYLMRALPPLARTVCSNPDAYVYLAESIRSEEHTSELQSREKLVCRLLLEKKNRT